MASCLVHLPEDDSVVLSGPAVRRLIQQGNGDAALLYVCLLHHRGQTTVEAAGRELRWDRLRLQAAEDTLRQMGFIGPAQAAQNSDPAEQQSGPPEYGRDDVAESLERDILFRSLTAEVERKLGKRLTTPDLSILLGLYDYLGLSADVIFLLVNHCMERVAKQYGPGRRPTLRQIEKEGYAWARRGIDTQERAAAYLKQYAQKQGRLPRYMQVLQLGDRPAAPTEEKYLLEWLEWGFPPETVALAYDRTVLKCHELKWGYINGILKNWHSKGLHTVEEVEKGEGERKRPTMMAQPARLENGVDPRAAALRKYIQKKPGGES